MSRIENFIPQLKKHRIQDRGDMLFLEFDKINAITLEKDIYSFIKQINGHLSLNEIFMFLNKKGISFSIEKSLDILQTLAEQDLLTNTEDYFKINSKPVSLKKVEKKGSELDENFFSQERLIGLIQKTTLFLECDRKTAINILSHSRLEKIKQSVQIIENGSKSPYFYIILTGEVGVYLKGECLTSLGALSVFGESAAIFDHLRNADVIASEDSWLLKVDASELVDTNSLESFDAYKGLKSRLILNQSLSANPLFQKIPNDTLQLFIAKCRIEKWGKEQTVVEQDTSSGDFYLILNGSVSVIKNGVPVTSLKEGDHFGEIAAIFNEPRTATILTESICTLLVLNQKALFEVLCSHFRLAIDIEKTAQKRWKSSANILDIFEEDFSESEEHLNKENLLSSEFTIDEDFYETSHVNYQLEVLDHSKAKKTKAS
jgi:CRP-like cAMP-binding protein